MLIFGVMECLNHMCMRLYVVLVVFFFKDIDILGLFVAHCDVFIY